MGPGRRGRRGAAGCRVRVRPAVGASFRHCDLSQADFVGARLGGADLSFADLTQANMTDADLRGASLWLVNSIQVTTDGTRLRPVERSVIQLGYVPVAVALFLLLAAVVRLARGIPARGRRRWRLRPGAQRMLAFIPAAVAVTVLMYLLGGSIAALWVVGLLRAFGITAAVLLVAALIEQLAPTRPVRTTAPSPVEPDAPPPFH